MSPFALVCCCAAVWALLLEHTHPRIATDVFYVAGDRVVSDPLCKPFSMGRNLFCVHSKKRMDDDPSQREAKQRTNRRTLSEMVKELNAVSCLCLGLLFYEFLLLMAIQLLWLLLIGINSQQHARRTRKRWYASIWHGKRR